MLIGDNITATENDGMVTLTVDTTKGGTPSKSGKSLVLASTRGNKTLRLKDGSEITVGINIYQKEQAMSMND